MADNTYRRVVKTENEMFNPSIERIERVERPEPVERLNALN